MDINEVSPDSATPDKAAEGSAMLAVDGLPASVRRYIDAVCRIYHCPREFVVAAVMATAATAVGKKIKVNEGRYRNSLVLWFVAVARSGSNKSYPMKLVTAPLRKIDAELYAEYQAAHDAWKAIPQNERTADEPRCPAIVLDDCTDERRSEILFMNNGREGDADAGSRRGAIGIYPELKGMFDAKNQYQNGGTTAISKLLRLFDGEDIKVDRRSGYTMLIRDPFCNIIGDLQTGMLRPTFGSELFMTNGLNQRFLFTIAEDIDYPERSHATLPPDTAREWEQTVRMLYEGICHDSCGNHCTLFRSSDGDVSLSEGADRLYDAYYNELQAKKAAARTDYEASVYSKLQIQVLRYAGIVHALEVAEEKGARADYYLLHASTMAYAIRCMRYFERMALQVYGILSTPGDDGAPTTKTATLRSLLRFYPETNRSRLAEALGVSGALISKVGKEARLRG